jgi:hypothetical protein
MARSNKRLYLDPRLVAPGDVLLHASLGISSFATQTMTRSKYSHARLAITGNYVFEALADGVFPTPLPYEAVDHNGAHALAVPLPKIRRAMLLRHRALRTRVETKRIAVLEEVLEAMSPFIGRPYSELVRLLGAASWPLGVRKFVASQIEKGRRLPESERGVFCSELVVKVFESMELEGFKRCGAPGTISPGDLKRNKQLEEVKGAVFKAESAAPSPADKHFIDEAAKLVPRADYATFYRELREIPETIGRLISEIKTLDKMVHRRFLKFFG